MPIELTDPQTSEATPKRASLLAEDLAPPAEDDRCRRARTGSPSNWRIGVGASVLLHSAFVCSLLFGLVRLAPTASPVGAVMTVEIAPTLSAPPTPPRQTPPGPRQIEAASKPKPFDRPKIPPPPKLLIPIKPEVMEPATPDPQPDRPVLKQTTDQTTAPQAIAAPPKTEEAAPTTGDANVASNAAQTWEGLLLAKLERNKRYPSAARYSHQEDVVYIRMVIDGAGRLTGVDVVRSRGYTLLDKEVVSLAHRASPFPPPPSAEGNPAVLVVPVQFFITHYRRD
jgi:protein TonB